MDGWKSLPGEVHWLILQHVPKIALPIARAVSKTWHAVIDRARPRRAHKVGTVRRSFYSILVLADHIGAMLRLALCEWPSLGIRGDVARAAASMGYVGLVELLRKRGVYCDDALCCDAAKYGHISVLVWARANSFTLNPWVLVNAANGGHIGVLFWALGSGYRYKPDVWSAAARGGHLEVLEQLRKCGYASSGRAAIDAAKRGHLDVVKWAIMRGGEGDASEALGRAASQGHLHIVKWLHKERGVGINAYRVQDAASSGHKDTVVWMCARLDESLSRYDAKQIVCEAALRGHTKLVQVLHDELGLPLCHDCCALMATHGRLDMVQWAHARGSKLRASVVKAALKGGYVDIIEWAINNGCPYDPANMYIKSARKGHLHVMEWARARDYPWDPNACRAVAVNTHPSVVEWIDAQTRAPSP